MNRWDFELNKQNGLDPSILTEGNGKKAYFRCDNGHLECVVINKFIDRGFNCLQCKSVEFNSPNTIKRWDWAKNDEAGLNPYTIGIYSKKKANFICDNGHEYTKSIKEEVVSNYCNICNSLGYAEPYIVNIWSDKNKKSPFEYTRCSNQKVWFKCALDDSHPDHLQSIDNKVTLKQGCPYCTGKIACDSSSFGYHHKDKIVEWSDKNEKTPFDYTYGSKEKVYWKCLSDSSHPDYLQLINSKHKGYGCPICRGVELGERNKIPKTGGSFGDVYDGAIEIWSNKNKKTPFDYKPNSGKKVWFKCLNSETHPDYLQKLVHKYARGTSCPVCSRGSITKINRIIYNRYESINPSLEHRLALCEKFCYVDILIPSINTIIEFDGRYWHEDIVDSDIEKTKNLTNLGYRVIRVREHGLKTLNLSIDGYYEIFSDNMHGYQYQSNGTKKTVSKLIKQIDEIIGFEGSFDIESLTNSVRD